MDPKAKTMDKIVALCKGRGYIFPGSEIYGGLANTWDYGPLGVEFKNNVKKAWWRKFVTESRHNVGLDCAILMNPQTWVASGHVGGFNDPLMDCKSCHERFRADKLIEEYAMATGQNILPEAMTNEEMEAFIAENIPCPTCGAKNLPLAPPGKPSHSKDQEKWILLVESSCQLHCLAGFDTVLRTHSHYLQIFCLFEV